MKRIVAGSEILKKAAEKLSMPWATSSKNNMAVDFHFEYLDGESINNVIEDFENGEEITLPGDNPGEEVTVKKDDFNPQEYQQIDAFMNRYKGKPGKAQGLYKYDTETRKYERML